MNITAERLYELLPPIYRIRDAEQGEVLKSLISIIAEQVEVLEENLAQSYDDLFIETCADWAIPYIGDLIGYRTLHGLAPKSASRRAEVANTIGYRRRKGTATMLEQLARDVTGWNARVVEFFELLATNQYMNHIRLHNQVTPYLPQWEPLERLDTAFDNIPRTINVRRIATEKGKHNIPNIGIFLWRLNDYPLTDSPAFRIDDSRFTFSTIGINTLLFTRPETEDEITHLAEPINVPEPISRRVLDAKMNLYYGTGKSFSLRVNDIEIPGDQIHACNLSDIDNGDWAHQPEDFIAIDPELGRIAFPLTQSPQGEVRVNFHYGFSAPMGGGEYERANTFNHELAVIEEVNEGDTIQDALDLATASGAVQINNSGRYEEALAVNLTDSQQLELRANNGDRPTLILLNDLVITGEEECELSLNGLLISGARVILPAENNTLRKVTFRHCTFVPGLTLTIDGEPLQPETPSLIVEMENVFIVLDHCIIGGIRSVRGATFKIYDSIIDATAPVNLAFGPLQANQQPEADNEVPGGSLEITNSTVIGQVFADSITLASNVIFFSESSTENGAPVRAAKKQSGCVRFSYIPPGSVVPTPYCCQPDLAVSEAIAAAQQRQLTPISEQQRENITHGVQARLRPSFNNQRFGRPDYCQLLLSTPAVIRTGADNGSEMGAFYQLNQPQRETNLRVRLDEYLRFGLEAGIFYAN